MASTTREPFPTEADTFDNDHRISFSKTSDTYLLEAEDGTEWEWLARAGKWISVVRTPPVLLPITTPGRLWQACVS